MKSKSGGSDLKMLGGRAPYLVVGTCWFLLMTSFFMTSPEDFVDHPGSSPHRHTTVITEEEVKQWNYQCFDSYLLNYTEPTRLAGTVGVFDVPVKGCPKEKQYIPSNLRRPQRRVANKFTQADLSCAPCRGYHHHGLGASQRRQFFFETPITFGPTLEALQVRPNVHVSFNLDNILFSTQRAHYDRVREKYYTFPNASLGTLPLPKFSTLTVLTGKWELNVSKGLFTFVTDWPGEVRAMIRTLFTFTNNNLVLEECDGREGSCSRVCPPQKYPYMPCNSPIQVGEPTELFARSKKLQTWINARNMNAAKTAIGLHGLIRTVQFTGATLFDEILSKHDESISVFASTWNIQGQVNGGVFGNADKTVPPSQILGILKDIFEHYLKDADVLDFEQYKALMESLRVRQNYASARNHIHISNVVRMIRESGQSFEIIALARFDMMWYSQIQFISSAGKGLLVKVTYDKEHTPDTTAKFMMKPITDGMVMSQQVGFPLFHGNIPVVQDWVLVGNTETMSRFEDLFTYARDNYIVANVQGGDAISAYMAENGQFVTQADFDVSREEIICQRMSLAKVHQKQLPLGLYDEAHGCYWHTKRNRM